MLPFIGARPITIAPNEHDRDADISVYVSGNLPAPRVAEQAEESAVVTAPISYVIHLPE